MVKVKYKAKASFDIETETEAYCSKDDSLSIWVAIMSDLENRYGLTVEYEVEDERNCCKRKEL